MVPIPVVDRCNVPALAMEPLRAMLPHRHGHGDGPYLGTTMCSDIGQARSVGLQIETRQNLPVVAPLVFVERWNFAVRVDLIYDFPFFFLAFGKKSQSAMKTHWICIFRRLVLASIFANCSRTSSDLKHLD